MPRIKDSGSKPTTKSLAKSKLTKSKSTASCSTRGSPIAAMKQRIKSFSDSSAGTPVKQPPKTRGGVAKAKFATRSRPPTTKSRAGNECLTCPWDKRYGYLLNKADNELDSSRSSSASSSSDLPISSTDGANTSGDTLIKKSKKVLIKKKINSTMAKKIANSILPTKKSNTVSGKKVASASVKKPNSVPDKKKASSETIVKKKAVTAPVKKKASLDLAKKQTDLALFGTDTVSTVTGPRKRKSVVKKVLVKKTTRAAKK